MITLKDFEDHLYIQKISYGTWRIIWSSSRSLYRTGITHDSLAIDRIHSDTPDRARLYGYTLRQAYAALYRCICSEFKKKED